MLAFDLTLRGGGVAARMEPGLHSLSGPSGSGKTTLLRALAGIEPCTGRIDLAGRAIASVPPHRRAVAMLFQDARLLDHLNVRGNLDYAARRSGRPVGPVVENLRLEPLLDHRPSQLSGGERKRVAFAQSLLVRAQLLLLDEPFAGLDDLRRAQIAPQIQSLAARRDLVTLLVSHDRRDHAMAQKTWRLTAQGLEVAQPRSPGLRKRDQLDLRM